MKLVLKRQLCSELSSLSFEESLLLGTLESNYMMSMQIHRSFGTGRRALKCSLVNHSQAVSWAFIQPSIFSFDLCVLAALA